jgi:hypothetical protein
MFLISSRRRGKATFAVDNDTQVDQKDQTYQVWQLHEITNVESLFGGLYSKDAPMAV